MAGIHGAWKPWFTIRMSKFHHCLSTHQGTRTSSKLFRAEHLVPPGDRKSRSGATCQSQEWEILWGGHDIQILSLNHQRAHITPRAGSTGRSSNPSALAHYAKRAHFAPFLTSQSSSFLPWAQEEGLEYSCEGLQECRHSIMTMTEGQE